VTQPNNIQGIGHEYPKYEKFENAST
jgi:hypothetical protein